MGLNKMAYGFDMKNGMPVMAVHVFEAASDGQLNHYIDGMLRAQVPPEGWETYGAEYPEALDVIDSMRAATATKEIADASGSPSP